MLIENARKKAAEILAAEEIYIKGIWSVDCLFNPNNHERVFDFKFLVVKSAGQGSAYSIRKHYDTSYLKQFMGKRVSEIEFDDIALEIAVLDSIFDKYQNRNFDESYRLSGSSIDKASVRAEIVANECRRLLDGRSGAKIVNVGVVTNVAKALKDDGFDVCGTDFDEDIVDKEVYPGVLVYPGDRTIELVRQADLAVITGMTAATDSADAILQAARENGTKVVVFAETGAALGDFFIEAGADAFVSEPFPFYIFDGETNILVKRKKF